MERKDACHQCNMKADRIRKPLHIDLHNSIRSLSISWQLQDGANSETTRTRVADVVVCCSMQNSKLFTLMYDELCEAPQWP